MKPKDGSRCVGIEAHCSWLLGKKAQEILNADRDQTFETDKGHSLTTATMYFRISISLLTLPRCSCVLFTLSTKALSILS